MLRGIRRNFFRLSPCCGQVPYVLLTRAPVAGSSASTTPLPLDLHVLSLSLAFILSQDQTLRCCLFHFFSFKNQNAIANNVCYCFHGKSCSLTSLSVVMPGRLDCLSNAGSYSIVVFLGWKIDRELCFLQTIRLKALVSCTTSIVAIVSMFSALPYLFRKSSAKVEHFRIPCKYFAPF